MNSDVTKRKAIKLFQKKNKTGIRLNQKHKQIEHVISLTEKQL